MKIKNIYLAALLAIVLVAVSCSSSDGDATGSEYMPDMAHSIAYEANLYDYYSYNTWGTEDDYHKMAQPRNPVNGTIPRGYAGISGSASPQHTQSVMKVLTGQSSPNAISVPINGAVPYYFGDNDDERLRATNELISNPFPITAKGLAQGKELYNIFCAVCHGEKGDGNGYLVAEENPNAKYPAQPRNFLDDEWTAKSNGAYYHSIMFGKGVMGSYADKISFEERWQVIHWIRALQAKDDKLVYTEESNTLNTIDVPGASLPPLAMDMENDDHHDEGDHHTDEDHSHDGDGHDDHGHDGHDH